MKSIIEAKYKEFNDKAPYIALIHLMIPKQWIAINVSKDKRTIKFLHQKEIELTLRSLLDRFFDLVIESEVKMESQSIYRYTHSNSQVNVKQSQLSDDSSNSDDKINSYGSIMEESSIISALTKKEQGLDSKASHISNSISHPNHIQEIKPELVSKGFLEEKSKAEIDVNQMTLKEIEEKYSKPKKMANPRDSSTFEAQDSNQDECKANNNSLASFGFVQDRTEIAMLSGLKEEAFGKEYFSSLRIIGQFNLGFILCSSPHYGYSRIIVIDQHAADEKRLFEKFLNSNIIKKQRLIIPLEVEEISPLQVEVVAENVEVLKENGFSVSIITNGNEKKVVLTTLPTVFSRQLAPQDGLEKGENFANLTFPPFRRILASKACRKAIKIGDALSNAQMEEIVLNLSLLNSPWNCPHGRPTTMLISTPSHLIKGSY